MNLFSESQITKDLFLNGNLVIYQPIKGYRAATDPVLLAAACPAIEGQHILELGCGVGTASFCLYHRVKVNLTGIEIQKDYGYLAIKNGLTNKIPFKIEICDLLKLPKEIRNKSFDHLIMNPPYYKRGTPSIDKGKNKSMRIYNPLSNWIGEGLKRLKPKGWLTIINKTENLSEILISLDKKAGDIQIKPLTSGTDESADRVIVRARKDSKSPTKLYPPLIIHTSNGKSKTYSNLAENIFRYGSPLTF